MRALCVNGFTMMPRRIGAYAYLVLLALGVTATSAAAKAPAGSESCRQVLAALMVGDVDRAAAVIEPISSERETTRENLSRINYALIGLLKGKKPRLERTLQDLDVETHPVSLQIWSFSDQEVYFVGCLFRWHQENAHLDLQFRNSTDEVVKQIKVKLNQSPA
jgi:hypothetical protein